jgi:hypothetical protein
MGTKYKKDDGPLGMSIESLPSGYVLFNIQKKEDGFYFYSDYIEDLLGTAKMTSLDNIHKVYHANDVAEMEYCEESLRKITIDRKYPFLIYTKLKNGKYNLNTIDYLYSENPNLEIEKENVALPKDLDSVTKNGFYRIEKIGLVTYYPIMKQIKYKTLSEFDYYWNFARFELPNGQKGWLTIDGKEYFDE